MSSNEKIEQLVVKASYAPLDPVNNFDIAVEYEKLNQTASAVSFYLRAAEYGYETHPLIAYASLLRVSICIEDQKDRNYSVSNVILQAIAYLPARPEAYFLMSRFHERSANWQECYTYAQTGLVFAEQLMQPLPINVDYFGSDCLVFQKAVAAWWIGRKDESLVFLEYLQKVDSLPIEYKVMVQKNLVMLKEVSSNATF